MVFRDGDGELTSIGSDFPNSQSPTLSSYFLCKITTFFLIKQKFINIYTLIFLKTTQANGSHSYLYYNFCSEIIPPEDKDTTKNIRKHQFLGVVMNS